MDEQFVQDVTSKKKSACMSSFTPMNTTWPGTVFKVDLSGSGCSSADAMAILDRDYKNLVSDPSLFHELRCTKDCLKK